jgi:uncharacterized protein (DUF2141 family)
MNPILLWSAAAAVLAPAAPASTTTLVVRLPALSPVGQVQVAVFNGSAAWRAHKKPVRSATMKVDQAEVEVRFEGMAPGVYGVMAYHDRNGNGRLDTLPVGLPVEPYGFSNNARGSFGPPAWTAASMTLHAGQTAVQTIRLR